MLDEWSMQENSYDNIRLYYQEFYYNFFSLGFYNLGEIGRNLKIWSKK